MGRELSRVLYGPAIGAGRHGARGSGAGALVRASKAGEEAGELSSVLLMDMLGVATGSGLGGAAVALSEALGAPLRAGLAGAFAIGALALVALLFTSLRLD